jgi:hypothetical protein
MCWILLLVVLGALSAASPAQAGVNAGGVLLLHCPPAIQYSTSVQSYCGLSNLSDCQGVQASAISDPEHPVVFYVMAAFPDSVGPRVKCLSFGVTFDTSAVVMLDHGSCADLELPDTNWPHSGSGTAQYWTIPTTSRLSEAYWFLAYATEPGRETTFDLVPHPTQGGFFVDDGFPAVPDAIEDFGALGFNRDGYCPPCQAQAGPGPVQYGEEGEMSIPPSGPSDLADLARTIRLGPHSHLEVTARGETRTYGPDETIVVRFEGGVGYINDFQCLPPYVATPLRDPIHLESLFGAIPSVRDYVSTHDGDATAVWNAAVEAWSNAWVQTMANISIAYVRYRGRGLSRATASAMIRDELKSHRGLDSVYVENADDGSINPSIWYKHTGLPNFAVLELSDSAYFPRIPADSRNKVRSSDARAVLSDLSGLARSTFDVWFRIHEGTFIIDGAAQPR